LERFKFWVLLQVSRIPLRVLYIFSDILYSINAIFICYRKDTVTKNLKKSFPNKTDKEIIKIRRKFFHNFFDYILETLKAFSISESELKVRVQHLNQHVFHECYKEGKDVIFLSGHVFNWEWMSALATLLPYKKCHPVYKKMNSKFWNDKIKYMRNRFGNKSIESNEVIREILKNKEKGNSAYMFVADQTPPHDRIHYSLKFLNQETPAFIGYDRLSTKRNLAFIYCDMKKIKRGFYQINYRRILPDNENFTNYEIVNKFYSLLENTIINNPDNWLWSHKRWKFND